MRTVLTLALAALFVPQFASRAEGPPEFWEVYQPRPDGLPVIPISGQFFAFDAATKKFKPSFRTEYNQIAVVWWPAWSGYGWVTAQDTRQMLPGSKVQGYRFGNTEANALDWYTLGNPPNQRVWGKVRDRSQPKVYRRDPVQGRVVSETAPMTWTSWGGTLEPLPDGDVNCTVIAVPAEVKTGEKIRFDVSAKGNATALTVFGQEMLLPTDFVEKTYDRAGVYDVVASVARGAMRSACRTTVRVIGRTSADDFGCAVTVEPDQLALRQTGLVTMKTFGAVTRAEYLNVPVPVGKTLYRSVTNSVPKAYYVHARVFANGQEKTCRAPFTVTENTPGR